MYYNITATTDGRVLLGWIDDSTQAAGARVFVSCRDTGRVMELAGCQIRPVCSGLAYSGAPLHCPDRASLMAIISEQLGRG